MANREQVVLNGRYELERRVGRGGMAEVFLARDRLLDRPVAIKILFPEFATDPSFVARFRREAQSAANLNHPNIVGVYDWGKERGTYYIVMEYIDGRSVSDILRSDGPLSPKKAAGLAAEVAAALSIAHQKGVVHRDVKPGNILITSAGEVKVADFGIARALTSSGEDNLTQTGSVMGTATYFSPEQAQGQPADPRSDLYSLGVVLYEMVAGKPPFAADSPVAIAYKHVQEEVPSLQDQVPDVPDAYVAVTSKALAKKVDERYQDARELRSDLLRFREGKPVRAPGAAAGAVVAAMAGPPTQATAAVPRSTPPTVPPPPDDLPPESEPDEHGRRTGWFFVAILVLLVVLGGLLYAFADQLGVFDSQTEQETVPSVVLKQENLAVQELENLGFVVQIDPVTNDAEAGIVLGQDPEPETEVDKGSVVTLSISAGPETGVIPNVLSLTYNDARTLLVARNFDGAKITRTEREDDGPAGLVLESRPKVATTQPLNIDIELVVSKEPPPPPTTDPPPTTAAPTTAAPTTAAPTTAAPTTTEPPPSTTAAPTSTTVAPSSTTTTTAAP